MASRTSRYRTRGTDLLKRCRSLTSSYNAASSARKVTTLVLVICAASMLILAGRWRLSLLAGLLVITMRLSAPVGAHNRSSRFNTKHRT